MIQAHGRAWEAAHVLLEWGGLTLRQRIDCYMALMAGPEKASLDVIALAAQILGTRQ